MVTENKGLVHCSFAKDLNFRFSGCSELLAEMAGCDSPHQMIGKDDYHLAWHRDADFFREKDSNIIQSGKCYSEIESIETESISDDPFLTCRETKIIITKAPLFDADGDCIGLCGSLVDITDLNVSLKITEIDELNRCWLGERYRSEYLTETEVNVLKGILISGERAVARELGISRSTVSTHIQKIKLKFQCTTIVELRKTVLESGLIHELFSKGILERYIKAEKS